MPRFSNAFQSHMVLQRRRPIPVWGFGAAAGSRLMVELGPGVGGPRVPRIEATVKAGRDGRWEAVLPTPPEVATGKSLVLSVARLGTNSSSQRLVDVTVGDVYLFTGQSNVDLPETYALQFDPISQRTEEEFADEIGSKGLIRVMIVPNQVPGLNYGPEPAAEFKNSPDCRLCPPPFGPNWDHGYKVCHCNSLRWARASAAAMRGFSALGWFTASAMAKTLPMVSGVPLGLVRSSWGGTKIMRWSGPDAVRQCPQSSKPGLHADLFHNMIHPMLKHEFSAVVWMHGASDTGSEKADFLGPSYYSCALRAMIRDWRDKFQQPSLPFIVVELPAYCNERDWATFHTWCDQKTTILHSTEYHLPAMRIAQAEAEQLPHVYMVTAMDLGSLHPMGGSIHSDKKEELGRRVALAARSAVYHEPNVFWEAPTALSAVLIDELLVRVSFAVRPDEFLVLNTTASCPPEVLPIYCTGGGFEALSNGTWHPVSSSWLGQDKSVVLRASTTEPIERVRYAFADWPVCSVRSAVTGLPARLFDLPVTVQKVQRPKVERTPVVAALKGGKLRPAEATPTPEASTQRYVKAVEKDLANLERDAEKVGRSFQPSIDRAFSTVKEESQKGLVEAEQYALPHWPIASLAALALVGTLCVLRHSVMGEAKGSESLRICSIGARGSVEPRTLSRGRTLEVRDGPNNVAQVFPKELSATSGTPLIGGASEEDTLLAEF